MESGTARDMHRYGIEDESWYEAARTALERRGFTLRVQPRSIVLEKDGRLPRLLGSAREFLDFAERQGHTIEPAAFEAADRYGDERSNLADRFSQSAFETPAFHGPAEPSRIEIDLIETAIPEAAPAQKKAALLLQDIEALQNTVARLEAELHRVRALAEEAGKQRDIWQMSANAAEDRLRLLQADSEASAAVPSGDRRFDVLRRFLARELHPDLAGEHDNERHLREALFKRVWAKVEQLT